MAIWCFQIHPGRIDVVDYYESSGHGFDHYADWLNERGYKGTDWVPHDAKVRDPSAPGARTRLESLCALGRHPKLVPNQDLMDGINAGRKTLPLAYFDDKRCAKGIECLRSYKAEWDDKARTFKKSPKSTTGRAMRRMRGGILSLAWSQPIVREEKKPEPMRGVGQITVDELLQGRGSRKDEGVMKQPRSPIAVRLVVTFMGASGIPHVYQRRDSIKASRLASKQIIRHGCGREHSKHLPRDADL
jgi:phage terminase large subunit